jgi:hypothetical protein
MFPLSHQRTSQCKWGRRGTSSNRLWSVDYWGNRHGDWPHRRSLIKRQHESPACGGSREFVAEACCPSRSCYETTRRGQPIRTIGIPGRARQQRIATPPLGVSSGWYCGQIDKIRDRLFPADICPMHEPTGFRAAPRTKDPSRPSPVIRAGVRSTAYSPGGGQASTAQRHSSHNERREDQRWCEMPERLPVS